MESATVPVDLTDGDALLAVDISDALSEVDKVKFTVHTRTSMPRFAKGEFSVIRLHEEFVWLHDTFADNAEYGGYVIPPPPPRPDFDASREKLRKLGDAEGQLTKEEFNKMKQELEAEYLATFKKTVAMHETFLCRLVSHPVFRSDMNLAIFLEYDKELNVRGKNKKEKLLEVLTSVQKSGDELLLSNTLKDVDEFFDNERKFLLEYFTNLRDATHKADKMVVLHKSLAENYIKISTGLVDLSAMDETNRGNEQDDSKPKSLVKFLTKASDVMEKMRRIEGRVASDQDLKLSDTLRYHMRDTTAAKDLLFRRLKSLSTYENANKTLEKARAKNKDVVQAENAQQEACKNFEKISDLARDELKILRQRRVLAFQKSLTELAELELKHSKAHAQMLKATIANLKAEL
eukprot:13973.XXX_590090_591441_1 [CDS] Oithona nana genome sequencing.